MNKIPIPNQYKDLKDYSQDYISIYKDDIKYFKKELPQLAHWSDTQIITFGDDFAKLYYFCAMQEACIDDRMLKMVIKMNETGKDMEELGKVEYWHLKEYPTA